MKNRAGEMQKKDSHSKSLQHGSRVCDERIEYDDAAILAFHPHLKARVNLEAKFYGRRSSMKEAEVLTDQENDSKDGTQQEQVTSIKTRTDEIVKQMLAVPNEKIGRLKKQIKTCMLELTCMKNDFENMDTCVGELENLYSKTKTLAKRKIDDLEVVIHQNRIILHLIKAAEEMVLFECHVTDGHHVVFADRDEVLVEGCSAHDESGNNSCCTCVYQTKMEVYDDVD